MDADTEKNARNALAAAPAVAEKAAAARLVPLRSLTNRVYKVEFDDSAYVLRIPDPRTADFIDRRGEAANAGAAATLGIAPEIVHFGADGTLLTRFIAGTTMSPQAFRERPGAVERAAETLARLHRSAIVFAGDFRLFETLDLYLLELGRAERRVPAAIFELQDDIARIRAALAGWPSAGAPCHCDPTGPNVIDTGERVVLIDWEFSAMNDPAFDLAYLSVEGEFGAAEDARLLGRYHRHATAAHCASFALHKALVDYLSALWELIRATRGGGSAANAERRLARCTAIVERTDFGRLLGRVSSAG